MLESELRNHGVKWACNAKVTKVEAGKIFVTELDDSGQVKKEHDLPFKCSTWPRSGSRSTFPTG